MKLGLAQYTSVEIKSKSSFITFFSDNLNEYFNNKDYGDGIKEIIIGVICVSPNYEPFFKIKKPKYIKEKKNSVSQFTKQEYEIEKCLTYDLKLDFETFKNGTEEENKRLLAKEILGSMSILDAMKSKIKDQRF